MTTSNPEWWKSAIVYQVYPKSFCDSNGDGVGDLNGIRSKLDYLVELGADVIWLNPIFASPQVDNGYDISDYRAIEPTLGTMADFDALLREAHAKGLKIILDLVVNHTSDQHRWFQEACRSRKNPYHDYYIWRDKIPNNWGSSFGGPAWTYVESVGQYYLHCFAPEQCDLNWDNPEVRAAVYDEMRFWLDRGIDGFRMDVITLISKDPALPDGPVIQNKAYGSYYAGCATGPHVHEYLQEMEHEVLSRYDVMTVGEAPHTSADQAQLYVGADRGELDMVFHFDHMHLDYDENGKYAKTRVYLPDLKRVMNVWQEKIAACGGWNSLYWSNHDQARAVSRFGNESPEWREKSAKMLGVCLHLMQGTPYVYEGEEIGMVNAHFSSIDQYRDVEALDTFRDFTGRKGFSEADTLELLALKSRDNARTPMQWTSGHAAGFTTGEPWIQASGNEGEVNVEAAMANPDSVWHFYQRLIALRHNRASVTDGRYELLAPDDEKVYAYLRRTEDETLVVLCNFSDEEVSFELSAEVVWDASGLVISNEPDAAAELSRTVALAPYAAHVYAIR
ncbi:alpha-glucosidase [Paratractidigestivibacter sp.]|uniref:glycoside hydrolase family 13 protein n=1 Tax=Paratractidigestivibacter sp. TaxID=2847316 RepID=UPI002ABD1595|nr:alpha-glucosidase [Paratractidigestivibacter sp.]